MLSQSNRTSLGCAGQTSPIYGGTAAQLTRSGYHGARNQTTASGV